MTRSEQEYLGYLEKITSSAEFAGADRLIAFLTYIVRETLAGRGDAILGKSIFLDLYVRDADVNAITESVVRVDASRLRKRLAEYYAKSGKSDAVEIRLDKGGYVPTFVERAAPQSPPPAPERLRSVRPLTLAAALAVLGIAFLGGGYALLRASAPQEGTREAVKAERAGMLALAPKALQARNLAEKATILIFPATEADRVERALGAFETVIELDPFYEGGYAGASHASAILAGLSSDRDAATRLLDQSTAMAEKAMELAPESAWSLSALAWTAFIARDYERATETSRLAVQIAPDSAYILGFDTLISVFAGEFERVAAQSRAARPASDSAFRFPWRTTYGVASFHLGNYAVAAQALTDAALAGEPVSEINMAHLIAAHQGAGDTNKARDLVLGFEETWPASEVSALTLRLFKDPSDAQAVLQGMAAAGWVDPLGPRN